MSQDWLKSLVLVTMFVIGYSHHTLADGLNPLERETVQKCLAPGQEQGIQKCLIAAHLECVAEKPKTIRRRHHCYINIGLGAVEVYLKAIVNNDAPEKARFEEMQGSSNEECRISAAKEFPDSIPAIRRNYVDECQFYATISAIQLHSQSRNTDPK